MLFLNNNSYQDFQETTSNAQFGVTLTLVGDSTIPGRSPPELK